MTEHPMPNPGQLRQIPLSSVGSITAWFVMATLSLALVNQWHFIYFYLPLPIKMG
ncbi:hypothetical protein [sulfur-oxidizing endosymbiont of Gigantopelta aegis]|uniref:hypothetical protein n=1 Tax=sulfur-oxidizing endosymbiont of Gigantopelta aegis TaxID=2794934 RepID=UPI0018DD322C|nr:hypothetical protein [sulfur-oxidizing endosymbiont of Gigantopelta aegis]